jgi:hypothetical protein
LIDIKPRLPFASIMASSPVPAGEPVRQQEAAMYGIYASFVGGLMLAVGVMLLAEKAAQRVEAKAKRRAEREQPAS